MTTTPLPTSTAAAPAPARKRSGFRVTTIVWGALLVAFAAIALVSALGGVEAITPAAILWGVIGFGALIVLFAIAAAIVAAVRSASARSAMDAANTAASPASFDLFTRSDEDQPIG